MARTGSSCCKTQQVLCWWSLCASSCTGATCSSHFRSLSQRCRLQRHCWAAAAWSSTWSLLKGTAALPSCCSCSVNALDCSPCSKAHWHCTWQHSRQQLQLHLTTLQMQILPRLCSSSHSSSSSSNPLITPQPLLQSSRHPSRAPTLMTLRRTC
ncbi:hypothetical protein COO60DRAFT_1008426 [Scenedesmus sp. NREL 46B-D3]|nr:hypothetical protein COO60DRAFT_1008426 [Scenedesmus sp. NREL 46B-D3]